VQYDPAEFERMNLKGSDLVNGITQEMADQLKASWDLNIARLNSVLREAWTANEGESGVIARPR
jgi:hypothetical protein